MVYGSKPVDGGHLILEAEDRRRLLADFPEAKPFVRPFLGSVELINGIDRWCLWLGGRPTRLSGALPRVTGIHDRVNRVRAFRAKSKKRKTVEQAEQPFAFGELRQPRSDYLAVPEVSSENRRYIPIGFVNKRRSQAICLYTVAKATHYTFGVLASQMHVAWVRYVMRPAQIRFQVFERDRLQQLPWPQAATDAQKAKVEEAKRKAVLDAGELPRRDARRPLRPAVDAAGANQGAPRPRSRRRSLLPQGTFSERPRPRGIPLRAL